MLFHICFAILNRLMIFSLVSTVKCQLRELSVTLPAPRDIVTVTFVTSGNHSVKKREKKYRIHFNVREYLPPSAMSVSVLRL